MQEAFTSIFTIGWLRRELTGRKLGRCDFSLLNIVNYSMDNLPSGERYLYQLFSLIEVGYLTVINPQGEEFNFGDKD